jgi:putative membrane protein
MSEQKDPRILFAAERTLLAWNRTSIALIAFGFLIERSGVLIKVISGSESNSISMTLTIIVGLVFILSGAFVAIYSSKQYSNVLKTLRPSDFPIGYSVRWGISVNICVAILGVVLSVALMLAY